MEQWMPDGHGLDDLSRQLVAEHHGCVHLRLTSPTGSFRDACGKGLGQWWSGQGSDVNCSACLEVVHA